MCINYISDTKTNLDGFTPEQVLYGKWFVYKILFRRNKHFMKTNFFIQIHKSG